MFGKKEHIELIKPQITTSQEKSEINNVNTYHTYHTLQNEEKSEYKSSLSYNLDSRISNIIKYINKYITQGNNILDLGCGDGFISDNLGTKFKVTKVDIKEGNNIVVHNLENAPYPFKDNSFDGIICSEVLEHLFNPLVLINESIRILKKNGIMILTVPNFNSIDNIITNHQYTLYNLNNQMSIEHIRHYTLDSLTQILNNRFKILDIVGNSPNMNPFFNNMRKTLGKYITDNNEHKTNKQMIIDMIIGECFPTNCAGIMIILENNK